MPALLAHQNNVRVSGTVVSFSTGMTYATVE